MATSVSSTSSTTTLDSYYVNLINQIMETEQTKLNTLTADKDSIEVKKAVYTDLSSKLSSLQSQVKALISTETGYSLNPDPKAAVSNVETDSTVLTATSSSSALIGTYNLSVTTLAKQHSVRSDRQAATNQALNLAGKFTIGGAETRSAQTQATIEDTVAAFGTAEVTSSKGQLGSGDYYVEVRQNGAWQFRLVDADGNPVSILKADGSGSATTSWQTIPDGATNYDTGRGLTIDFGDDRDLYQAGNRTNNNAAKVSYTAQGASITVNATDTLQDVANLINEGVYGEGNEVSASIVDNHLVITSKYTGADHAILASGQPLVALGLLTSGGEYKNELTPASDAQFTINGMPITRSTNTGLTDVLPGITLNLADDAEGKSATLTVSTDLDAKKNAVTAFINSFNSLETYLTQKTTSTKVDDQKYERGALAGESNIVTLRYDLQRMAYTNITNAGQYKSLAELGITIGDNFQIKLSDASKLENALRSNPNDVKDLLDAKMAEMNDLLTRFTGDTGMVSLSQDAISDEEDQIQNKIDAENDRLTKRKEALTAQYADIQAQMTSLTYLQQTLSALGTFNITT
ncbi:MAG: flagellar filament capping protein FliD [Chloroflexi bacterium]|nr:flagellar filament capping protein FliD [Anaerolineaceae bacterium]NMB90650.1 flagellar filament capping protein FliD [Chloroflexota bacterium]